jgi:hypothetical protein
VKLSRRLNPVLLSSALAVCIILGGAATSAATTFDFLLHNHPDGVAQPPLYGLRLDELVNTSAGHDIFTFNFDDPSIADADRMHLVYDDVADTITISGKVKGGLVTANAYTDPNWTGTWSVNFVYDTNISFAMADPDFELEVSPQSPSNNNGSIQILTGPNTGTVFSFLDGPTDGGFSFRFNNTDDHRLAGYGLSGPDTFVGWGWVSYPGQTHPIHVESSDWLFTGEKFTPPQNIPEPASLGLLASGLLAGFIRRRRGSAR